MNNKKIIIIGGGASGLVAAIAVARRGCEVVILEKNDRVGKKILATGNGRCNYSNINITNLNYHGSNTDFLEEVLNNYPPERIVGFFKELGIHEYIDDTGKIFPNSLQASSILDVLRMECKYLGVKEICNSQVIDIIKNQDGFTVKTIDESYKSDKVIAAFGGKASPQLSSDGSGYEILKKLGHKTNKIFPGLVQLKLENQYLKRLSGVKISGQVKIISEDNENNEIKDFGEILFTNYGISGPPILQLSRHCIEKINKNINVEISLDIFPDYTKNQLYKLLESRFINMKYKTIRESFIGLINKRLIDVVLKESSIDNTNIKGTKFNTKDIYQIVNTLKNWRLKVTGPYHWEHAQITAGGIDTKEIDNHTMESKIIKGLYIIGEILDIDGDCGGYNLHWAWATGHSAGSSI